MSAEIAFGKILKQVRVRVGLSQDRLARLSNLDRTYISLLERGLRQPSLTTILSLSDALNIEPHELVRLVYTELATSQDII